MQAAAAAVRAKALAAAMKDLLLAQVGAAEVLAVQARSRVNLGGAEVGVLGGAGKGAEQGVLLGGPAEAGSDVLRGKEAPKVWLVQVQIGVLLEVTALSSSPCVSLCPAVHCKPHVAGVHTPVQDGKPTDRRCHDVACLRP